MAEPANVFHLPRPKRTRANSNATDPRAPELVLELLTLIAARLADPPKGLPPIPRHLGYERAIADHNRYCAEHGGTDDGEPLQHERPSRG